jgi:hypothetical protein
LHGHQAGHLFPYTSVFLYCLALFGST